MWRIKHPSPEARFWSRIDKQGGDDGCWLWTGQPHKSGYGVLSVEGQQVYAHRFSWSLANGPIPDGLFILHSCDTPPCVRPSHLFLGDQKANMADMAAKGRSGPSNHPERMPRGECNGKAKLTAVAVAEIHRLRAEGVRGAEIARRFGISPTTVCDIASGRIWRHVAPQGVTL